MAGTRPNVLTIAPGIDFARTLVEALVGGEVFESRSALGPVDLGQCLIFVPTRRFAQGLEDAFAAYFGETPFLIPDICAMGETEDAGDEPGLEALQPLREIEPLERAFALRPLIASWQGALEAHRQARADGHLDRQPGSAALYSESLSLALQLGRLIDEMHHDGVALEQLASIRPDGFDPARFDEYWSMTRDLLALAARQWPDITAARGGVDASFARLQGLRNEARRLEAEAGDQPVLVLGSTGSVRATAELMRSVSRLRRGAVVLPGLDQRLDPDDDAAWDVIGHEEASIPTRFAHPQASLKRALEVIGIDRKDVRTLGQLTTRSSARNALISEALRPVETVQIWRASREAMELDQALEGMGLIEARDEGEEARACALLIRETLEAPDKTVLFVSADQSLASRVEIELGRWGIEARSSVPRQLLETPAGQVLILMLKAAHEGSSASFLALLRHPLTRLGYPPEDLAALTDALDLTVFRGRRFGSMASLASRVSAARQDQSLRPSAPAQRIAPEPLARLPECASAIDHCLATLRSSEDRPLQDAIAGLIAALRSLTADTQGSSGIDREDDGIRLLAELDNLARLADPFPLPAASLQNILITVLGALKMPGPQDAHPRLFLLGPLEARLVRADRVILGGANEGSFPPGTGSDPFLNLPMRLALGLQAPDRRIGQSAHDFTMMAGAADFWMTRAFRSEGQPAMPSRFLRRLEAFSGLALWDEQVRQRGNAVLGLVNALDDPEQTRPAEPPAIIPFEPRIPARLSITEAETLRRDPYALYARHLLGLRPLDPLDPDVDARERGTILHAILDEYTRDYHQLAAPEASQRLRDIGQSAFRPLAAEQEMFRFWWRDFEALIDDFITFDDAAREQGDRIFTEVRAGYELLLSRGERVRLVGKIDRIALHDDGTFSLFDFKTGEPPGNKEVLAGNAPQLTLSAALVARGGIVSVPDNARPRGLAYFRIGSPGKTRLKKITAKDLSLDDLSERAFETLVTSLQDYAAGTRAYRSQVRPRMLRGSASDYDHLARRGEWHIAGDENGDEEDEE